MGTGSSPPWLLRRSICDHVLTIGRSMHMSQLSIFRNADPSVSTDKHSGLSNTHVCTYANISTLEDMWRKYGEAENTDRHDGNKENERKNCENTCRHYENSENLIFQRDECSNQYVFKSVQNMHRGWKHWQALQNQRKSTGRHYKNNENEVS